MIDPIGKRQMSAMEELQAIAQAEYGPLYVESDFALWERELDTPTIRAALEYMEGEGA